MSWHTPAGVSAPQGAAAGHPISNDPVKSSPLVQLGEARLADHEGWSLTADEAWCHVRPVDHRLRRQGWKLHLSSRSNSALDVLDRALGVLLPARCVFKFASTPQRVRELNGGRYPRGGAGKFITVYPEDDDQFRQLAVELDRATLGLVGPTILSDRPYRPGSLVHYRYGAFVGEQVLSNDGEYRHVITAPDGTLVEDRRDAWFAPPVWATAPFSDAAPQPAENVGGVLLADRFVVRRAIRHANKGGVFEATDRLTSAEVVIKQARAHVGGSQSGWEVRDALRNEAEMLDLLAPLDIAPRRLALFEQGGDLFLVQQRIEGMTLRAWCTDQANGDEPGLPWNLVAATITKLVNLLASVQSLGVVVRDLSPVNLMVRPDGTLALIDLEFAAREGADAPPVGTPGYSAPEQSHGVPAAASADLYSLGALTFLLSTGTDPLLAPEAPTQGGTWHRVKDWLTLMAETNEAATRAYPLILGSLAETPENRWSLHRARVFLTGTGPATIRRASGKYDLDRLLADGTSYLLATMTPKSDVRLWPASQYGSQSDVCNVHHGAGGILGTLTWLAEVTGDEAVLGAVRTACRWIQRRLAKEPQVLPGLHFGKAGTIWALYDAARLLNEQMFADRAVALIKQLPLQWPNPDVTHGMAGAGHATLRLWLATQDAELGARAREYARVLAERAQRQDGLLLWTVPESFESQLAGLTDYGFAHGTAGIASFFLAAGSLLGEPSWIALADEAGDTLRRVAHHDQTGTRWSSGPREHGRFHEYWCSGSSGVGTYLIRLWQVTGDDRARELAEGAAEAVWRRRWQAGPSICHGLAGNGEFLLDLAAATGDDRYRCWAEDLAMAIAARAVLRDGRLLAPDETMLGFGTDYGVGVAGWVAYLLRVLHGGPRRWMVEPALLTATSDCGASR